MSDYHLVVSNPPHAELDAARAARVLGMTATEVRMKASFPSAEIWAADTNEEAARAQGKELVAAGVRAAHVPGGVVAAVPSAAAVHTATLGDDAIMLETATTTIGIQPETPVVVVLYEPPTTSKSGGRTSVMQQQLSEAELEDAPFAHRMADLYVRTPDGWRCGTLDPAHTKVAGPGDPNMMALLNILGNGYQNVRFDERLVGVLYKFGMVSGMGTTKLLAEIAPDLAKATPPQLGSRLAFLTAK